MSPRPTAAPMPTTAYVVPLVPVVAGGVAGGGGGGGTAGVGGSGGGVGDGLTGVAQAGGAVPRVVPTAAAVPASYTPLTTTPALFAWKAC